MEVTRGNTNLEMALPASSSDSSTNVEPSDRNPSMYSRCMKAIDVVNHILIVALTVFTLCYSLRTINTLNLHTTLCTIGYVLLMSEAIVVLAGDSFMTTSLTHRTTRHVHWVLQVLGVICTVIGVSLIYNVKQKHFRSTHAILGITSVALMLFLAVFGYPVFVAVKLRKIIRPVVIKFGHNFFGLSCFAIGMAAECYGYKKYGAMNSPNGDLDIKLMCIIVVALITILSVRKALPNLCTQFVSLFR